MGSTRPRRHVILTEGQWDPDAAKTAQGMIRYGSDTVVAVLDSSQAGRNVADDLPGHAIPFAATLADALPLAPDALLTWSGSSRRGSAGATGCSWKPFIRLHEEMAGLVAPPKVVAIARNTRPFVDDEEARRLCARTEAESGPPTDDLVRFGPDRLWTAITAALGSGDR